ncbi:MAG: PKD domain-containing protein [Acidimicrobiales bacterium]
MTEVVKTVARRGRTRKVLSGLIALGLVLAVWVMAASAQTGPLFKFGNVSNVEPDSIALDGKNWSTAKANIEAHLDGGQIVIPGSARANASFTLSETEVTVDDDTTTIVFRGKSSDRLSLFAGPGGETDVLVILSWDGPSDTAPDIGVTFSNRVASLGSALGLDPDSFLGSLTTPSFATTFGRTDGNREGNGHFSRSSNLPTAATDYYAEIYGSAPGQVAPLKNVGNGLQATTTIDVDALGSAAGDIFPYSPGSPLVLEGSLGIGLDDTFDLAVSGWNITATLPAQDLPDVFPSFIDLADSTQRWKLGLKYDVSKQLTTLSATVNAKTELFGPTTNFALTATIGAGAGPDQGGGGGTTTTTAPSSTTSSTVGSSTTGATTSTTDGTTSTTDATTTTSAATTTTTGATTTTTRVFNPRLVEVSLSANINTDWTPPSGFDFIQVTNLKVEGKFAEQRNAAGQISTKFTGGLKGQALIGGKVFKLETSGELKRASGTTQASGKFRLDFADVISTKEILDSIGVDTDLIPSVVTDPSVGPVSLEVGYKDGTAELILTGEMSAYTLPTGQPIAARFLLRLDTNAEFMFGLRPASDPALKLSKLLPDGMTVPDQIDFILADDESGFGFVLASSAFSKSTADMSPLVAEFFRPLEGKKINDATPFNVEIPGPSLTIMASFKMPEDLTNLVETLGVQPRVFARGTLPLDPTGTLSLKVGMRARGDILPDWISKTELSFVMSASAAPAEVSIGIEGSIDFRFRAGLPPDVVAALDGAVPVTASVPVPEGSPCANGTVATKSGTNLSDVRAYCYDELRLTVGADIVLTAVPPSVKLALRGSLQTVNPNAVWNPFGLEWIALDNGQMELDIGVSESGITVGMKVNGRLLIGGRDLSGALSADVSVIPGSPPSVSVKLRAIQISSGSGLSMSDVMSFTNTVAGQELVDPANLGVPNFALRNFDLSFSPLGDPSICVPQGIVLAADLYVNPRNNPPAADYSCDNGVRAPSNPDGACGANFDKGCVMGGNFQISLTGIKGQADLASLEFGPIHIGVAPPNSNRPDPGGLRADFALTLGQQKLVISGAGYFDNVADPNAGALFEGQVFVSLKPTTVQVYGQAEIFGRGAMFDSTASIDILSGGSPELSIYVLMAVDGDQVGQPAWSQLVLGETEEPLQVIADVATVAGYLLDELDRTGDPIHVLAVAPGAAEASNVDLPDWVDLFNDKYLSSGVQDIADGLSLGRDQIADIALNGSPSVDVPGVPSIPVEEEICEPISGYCYTIDVCLGISQDGGCWITPPFELPGVSGICSELPAAARNGSGDCTAPLLVSAVLIPVFEDVIDAVIDPFVDDAIDFEIRHLAEISEGILNGSIPLLELDCAEFDFELSSARQEVRLAMQATVLARAFGFETGFDFSDPEASAAALLPNLVSSWLDPSNISCGEPRSDEFNELVESGVDPSDRPYLTAEIRTDDNLIIEGNALSGTVVANREIDSTWQAELVAKTADGVVIPALSETITFAPGATERRFSNIVTDDFAIGTARDALTLELTAVGVPAEDLPTDLCCDLDATSVTLVNSPPKIENVSVSGDREEGSTITLSWTIDDPGEEANFPITIDWGDGDTFSPTFGSSTEVSIPHVYADDGSYVVTITQYDDDTGRDVASLVIDIANLAPVVGNITAFGQEGAVGTVIITPADPGVFDPQTVTVDFGDGSPITDYYWEPSFGRSLRVEHVYSDRPGVSPEFRGVPTDIYDVTVTLTDNGGLSSEPTEAEAPIGNQRPVIEDLEMKIDASQFATATGRVVDPGINDTHTVFVSFLDGEDPLQEIIPEPDGTFTATFQYPEPDEVVVAAYAVDDDGTRGFTYLDEDTGDGEGQVAVEMQPRPSAVFDTGDRDVTFTATISNVGFLAISVRSISDDVYGEQCTDDTIGAGRQVQPGESFDCVYVGAVDGDVGELKSNTVTVGALAQSQGLQFVTATAEVNIVADGTETADVEIDLDTDVASVVPPGRLVNYTATIENVGSGPFTIDAISDAQIGDVCETVVGTEVGAGQSVTCDFAAGVGGAVGTVTTRTVTVGVSNLVGSDTAAAEASVEVVGAPDVPDLLVFAVPHPRIALSGEEVQYNVSIRNVGPSSFTIDSIEESVGAECTEIIGQTLEPQEIASCGINEAVFGDVGETLTRQVTVTVSNALGTDTQTAEGRVQIGAGPSITLDPVETGEVNQPTTVSGSFDGNLDNLPQLNINWGDGGENQFVAGGGVINDDGTFSIDHTYAEAGTFEILAILDDRDNLRAEDRTTVLIRAENVLPELTVDPLDSVIAGGGVDLIGSFTDANTDDTHTATVDWGDGSPIADAIVAEVDGSGSFVAQHTYSEVGDYEITVTLTDDRGFPATDVQTVTVSSGTATIGGAVLRADDSVVADVQIDLFEANADGSRGTFLGTARTDDAGRYEFTVVAGCNRLTFIAPDGDTFSGSRWLQPVVCVDVGDVVTDLNGILDGVVNSILGGRVTFGDDSPVPGVKIDLFHQADGGGRGQFAGFMQTGDDGRYSFDVVADCYVLTFTAPDGETFSGSRWFQPVTCIAAGEVIEDLDAELDQMADASLGGTITRRDGSVVEGVQVTFFDTGGDGSRGTYLGQDFSGANGTFAFQASAGCYWLVFVAPDQQTFINNSPYFELFRCVDTGDVVTDLDAVLQP